MRAAMKRLMKSLAYSVAPVTAGRLQERLFLARKAAELRSRAQGWGSGRECFEALLAAEAFTPVQKRSEFTALLGRLEELRPSRVCEIGAGGGGTLLSFAHTCAPPALIISVDLSYFGGRRRLLEGFGNDQRRIVCLQVDSHAESTKQQIEKELAGNQLDFLFIDGDHSYDGVAADFAMYSPLVRPGGLIAFHDIVPDLKARCGVKSLADTGEVPRFWNEIRPVVGRHEEFIDDLQQDGFGIGLVYWSGGVEQCRTGK